MWKRSSPRQTNKQENGNLLNWFGRFLIKLPFFHKHLKILICNKKWICDLIRQLMNDEKFVISVVAVFFLNFFLIDQCILCGFFQWIGNSVCGHRMSADLCLSKLAWTIDWSIWWNRQTSVRLQRCRSQVKLHSHIEKNINIIIIWVMIYYIDLSKYLQEISDVKKRLKILLSSYQRLYKGSLWNPDLFGFLNTFMF